MADVIAVHEHADVRPQFVAFGDDPIAQCGVPAPQQAEGIRHSCRRGIEWNRSGAAGEIGQETGDLDRDHHTRAALTHTTGGKASRTDDHDAPASFVAKILPLRVPK